MERRRGRPKKEVRFFTITKMLDYAIEQYPELKAYLNDESNTANSANARQNMRKHIKQTLLEHKLILKTQSDSKKTYKVSEKIAKFVIDDILSDYFARQIDNLKAQKNEIMEEQFKEEDRLLTEKHSDIARINSGLENEGSSMEKEYPDDYEDGIHKDFLEYQLLFDTWYPQYEGDSGGISAEIIDVYVNNAMLRALFGLFFEFDEKNFRKDFIQRLKHIHFDEFGGTQYDEGYTALNEKLKNPVNHYIFPKKQ